jgi:phospholipase C
VQGDGTNLRVLNPKVRDRLSSKLTAFKQPKTLTIPEVIAAMFKLRVLVFAMVALAMGGTLGLLEGCGGGSGGPAQPAPPAIAKTFNPSMIALNGTSTLTFNLSNPNAGTALSGIGFSDSLPAALVISTPNGLTGGCGGGTITATAGSGSVGLTGATLAPRASCSFSVNVTGTMEGTKNNMTSAVTSNEGNGNSASASVMVGGSTGPIQHVVVIFQENRTPDNLFQDPVLIKAGADIAQSGVDSHGNTIQLQEVDIAANYNPSHSHSAFELMCDLNSVSGQCQMDGANLIPVTCPAGIQNCVFAYVNPSEVQPYFQMAETYTFADHMFQTNQGPSMPAHQFIISGTSAPSAESNLFAAENPITSGRPNSGCDAPAGTTVALIDPTGDEKSNTPIYPCFEHPTLTDLLEKNGNIWRYYTSSGYAGGSGLAIWVGPEAIQHICEPLVNGMCGGSDWTNNVVLNQAQILTDITNLNLADVSWVIPTGQASDHPGITDGSGPSWVASVVNAIGNSPYWGNTAIFVTWDDWGGLYDHVPPPQVLVNCSQWGCGYVYGFRVPMIVISPYAKAQYISKQQYDFGSILRFIEERFNLPSLNYADAAAVNDFSDCFNFSQTPLPFQTIPAALKAEHFLNDKTPPTDPDDD